MLNTLHNTDTISAFRFRLYWLLRGSLPKTGPLRFGSENQFPLNFAHEYILVQK